MPNQEMSPESSGSEFSALLLGLSEATAKEQVGVQLMKLLPSQRFSWLSALVNWLTSQGTKRAAPAAALLLKEVPAAASGRIAAVRLTLAAASHHGEFQALIHQADWLRDQSKYPEAEYNYWQALQIFPLHPGYRVQYGHTLKEQQKHLDAYVQYCFALGTGAASHDVSEHLLFASRLAGLRTTQNDVERVTGAWQKAEQTLDDWDAPPLHSDFIDFAKLLWGNAGMVTPQFLQHYLLTCATRKRTFISLLESDETARSNRLFFTMMHDKTRNTNV